MDNGCFQIDDSFFDKFSGDTLNAVARKKVLASLSRRTWQGTALVTYQSAGKLLIVDHMRPDADRDRAIAIANGLAADGFNCTVLISSREPDGPDAMPSHPLSAPNVTIVAGQLDELSGFLGRFSARWEGPRGNANLAQPGPGGRENFDLVLDLDTPAFLQREVLPPGYYAPGADPEKLSSAVQEIAQATGAFGKPVIGSRSGGIPDAVKDGKTGFLINPEDHQQLAEILLRLARNKDLGIKLGRNGYNLAKRSTSDKIAERLLSIIERNGL